MNKNQKGFSAVEIAMVIFIIGLVSLVGWLVWDRNKSDKSISTDSTSQSETVVEEEVSVEYEAVIPSGWVAKSDENTKLSYAVPSAWGDKVTLEKYTVGDNVSVGFGAPVKLRYSTDKQWQTYEMDAKNQPTVLMEENLVKTAGAKAEEKYLTSYYSTGDGPSSQYRVLVVKDATIYQFMLPTTCEDADLCGADTTFTSKSVMDVLNDFVKTLKFN